MGSELSPIMTSSLHGPKGYRACVPATRSADSRPVAHRLGACTAGRCHADEGGRHAEHVRTRR